MILVAPGVPSTKATAGKTRAIPLPMVMEVPRVAGVMLAELRRMARRRLTVSQARVVGVEARKLIHGAVSAARATCILMNDTERA